MTSDDDAYHSSDLEEPDNAGYLRLIWLIFFAPVIVAFFFPLTGNYIVDVLALASPMLIGVALSYFLLSTARNFILRNVDERITDTNVFLFGYVFGSMTLSLFIGFAIYDRLEDAAIDRFGDAYEKSRQSDELPPIEDVREIE